MTEIRLTELPEDMAYVAALRKKLEVRIDLETPETRPQIEALRRHLLASESSNSTPGAK